MPADPFPSVRRRRLGSELRRMREDAARTCEEAGAMLDCHHSKIVRMERGQSGIRRPDLRALLDFYGVVDPERRTALEVLAGESRRRGWWQRYGDVIPPTYADFISLESDAVKIRTTALAIVPGLLQTREYAHTIITSAWRRPDEIAVVDKLVEVRMARQQRLTATEPVELTAVLSENILRQRVGGDAVMHAQLEYLLSAADLPNVSVLVLPDDAGAHPGLHGSFVMLGFQARGELDVVLLENLTSSLYFEEPDEIAWYDWAFESQLVAAAPQARSIGMIRNAIENLG